MSLETENKSISSIVESFKGKETNQLNVESTRDKIFSIVYKRKISQGKDLNRPLFDNYQNLGRYIGSEVIFDQDPISNKIFINYVECYGNANEINAVFEDETGRVRCVYIPRAEAEKKTDDDLPYWFVWAKNLEMKNPIDYYRLWI